MVRALFACTCMSVIACTDGGATTNSNANRGLPPPTGSHTDLIGKRAPEWSASEWSTETPISLSDLRGHVVVVRFWTDTCPQCERSMPSLEDLARRYADLPVIFVGLYHSKPLGSERPWRTVVDAIDQWGVTFPVGYDREWKTVKSWWLDGRGPRATSATFVIGADGTYVHVHPGPVYFPGDDGDFAALEAAIDRAVSALDER